MRAGRRSGGGLRERGQADCKNARSSRQDWIAAVGEVHSAEPGYFAQFYPNLDVLNGGAPTPAARLGLDPAAMQAYAERESGVGPAHFRAIPVGRRSRR
jgi:hypothetical protein